MSSLQLLIVDKQAYLTRNNVKQQVSLAIAKKIQKDLKKKADHGKN